MAENKSWKVMCWNVRGLNSDKKWNSIRDKIIESRCDIACLQETKKDFFDNNFIRNFCPSGFDSFAFKASAGASGGMLTIWKSALFSGTNFFRMNMLYHLNSPQSSIMIAGFLLISMPHAPEMARGASWNGLEISKCLLTLTG